MSTGRRAITRPGLQRAFVDVSFASLYALFAYAHLVRFRDTGRPSLALVVATETLFAVFFLVRRPAAAASRSTWDWCIALGGTAATLLFRPSPSAVDVPVAEVLQGLGTATSMLGVLFLNRSVGVVPAYRGVRSRGAYAVVRHPLYSGYTLANAGYVLNNWTALNLAVFTVALALQIARIFAEERLLARYADYRAYMARTRWRLVPFVF